MRKKMEGRGRARVTIMREEKSEEVSTKSGKVMPTLKEIFAAI
jgi:hypothetical protein